MIVPAPIEPVPTTAQNIARAFRDILTAAVALVEIGSDWRLYPESAVSRLDALKKSISHFEGLVLFWPDDKALDE